MSNTETICWVIIWLFVGFAARTIWTTITRRRR